KLRDFSGESVYVGIDSDLKRWQVTLMSEELELQTFSQEPDSGRLISFLEGHFPGADYDCVYEAGFSGFNAQRELAEAGIDCRVSARNRIVAALFRSLRGIFPVRTIIVFTRQDFQVSMCNGS